VQQVFKNDQLVSPKISIVLLDWSCRESFHILDYLEKQTVSRSEYELIWIEYYSRKSSNIEERFRENERKKAPPPVDQWVLMEIPNDVYYHKHILYNAAILLSRGNIVTFCDSDAIVRKTFVEAIVSWFDQQPNIVVHLDQVRNNDKRFYPFNYPSIESVVGQGCINWYDGKTTGLWDTQDVLHTRNYGACMAARRDDLIAIGGADEHVDYLGHVCGPYEMTFRLINAGKTEIWHPTEFLYHVWHPGQAGENNYVGPHDGRHMSSRAIQVRFSGRILPFVENLAIRQLRIKHREIPFRELREQVLPEEKFQSWSAKNIANLRPSLWPTLLLFRRRIVTIRLAMSFLRLLLRRIGSKGAQWMGRTKASSHVPAKATSRSLVNTARARAFFISSLNFFLSMIHRSRDCLNTALTEGHDEVSFYGTDDLAEILYDLSFELPVKIKSVYDDCAGERFHKFKVLPIERYGSSEEPIIVTGSAQIENKVKRLKALGVSSDRFIIMV